MDTNLKDKNNLGKKVNMNLTATTWGTLLIILIFTVISVGVYEPIKNLIIGYMPANETGYNWEIIKQELILIFTIGGVSILLLTVFSLAVPYKFQKQSAVVRVYNSIYLEFKIMLWIGFFVLSYIIATILASINGEFINGIIHEANGYFYATGFFITFIFYNLIYLSLIYFKHLYYKGFVYEIVNNSITGRFCKYLTDYIKKTVKQIIDVEITREHKKKLFLVIAVNLFVLLVIAFTGSGLGTLIAFAYTLWLFNCAMEVIEKLRALNSASNELSRGNFNITLPEDMGLLSSFAKNLNNVKEGFKLAVEKEVKSHNMKTQLITGVSHDLKTPLTSIITYVDLLKNEDLDDKTRKEYIDILDKKSKRLQVLIEDLFEASKASSGNIELNLEDLDVVSILRQTLGEMEEKIKESTLQLRTNFPEHGIICNLDGARTFRIFENIINNILKYSMPNSRVYIDVEEDEKKVNLIFKNISAYEINFDPQEITERFIRGDKSRNTEGSGLGLAIVKGLVELQKGTLEIKIDGDLFKLKITFPKMNKSNFQVCN